MSVHQRSAGSTHIRSPGGTKNIPKLPATYGRKQITATVTGSLTLLQTCIDTINLNLLEILALMGYNGTGMTLGYTAWAYFYDFDANPTFDITKGAIFFGYFSGSPESDLAGSPFAEAGWNPVTGWDGVGLSGGFITKAQALTALNKTLKTVTWGFVYDPFKMPGSAVPLWQSETRDAFLFAPFTFGKIGNITSRSPEPDINTRTTGCVFDIPQASIDLRYHEYTLNSQFGDPTAPVPPVVVYFPDWGAVQYGIFIPGTTNYADTTNTTGSGGTRGQAGSGAGGGGSGDGAL